LVKLKKNSYKKVENFALKNDVPAAITRGERHQYRDAAAVRTVAHSCVRVTGRPHAAGGTVRELHAEQAEDDECICCVGGDGGSAFHDVFNGVLWVSVCSSRSHPPRSRSHPPRCASHC